jgi:single-strand DNA-binding protein
MNKSILIGNLGKDPVLKMTTDGKPVARFSLATTESWKNSKGEKQTKTEWHNIVVWGKQAEVAEKFLRKGKQVKIEGRIQHRDYTDQAGAKKSFTEIKCDNFVMLGKGKKDGQGAAQQEELLPSAAAGGGDVDSPE